MAIQNFPTALQPIIQQGFLEHRFEQALRSRLGFRAVADKETFPNHDGETVTKTRAGLLPTAATPLNPAYTTPPATTVATLDSGLTPVTWGVEQYTLAIAKYGLTMDLNIISQRVGIESRFVQNAYALGENAVRTRDEIARNALFGGVAIGSMQTGGYIGGNTRVRVASTSTAVSVDDVRGFLTTAVNGVQTMVTSSTPMAVTINSNPYVVSGVAVDTTNVTTTLINQVGLQGMSGVLTLTSAVAAGDGAAGTAVVAATAPTIIRPNGRATAAALTANDVLTMSNILDAIATLRLNAVPTVDGLYNAYLDPKSSRQLFADPDFKQLFQGATSENALFAAGMIENAFLGVRFLPTNESPVQPVTTGATSGNIAGGFAGNGVIRRPIICGQGVLIEGNFDMSQGGIDSPDDTTGEIVMRDGVRMITRAPLDRFQEIIAQTWEWIGGYVAPTDLTTTPLTVPTATNSAYKRAVVIEHFG